MIARDEQNNLPRCLASVRGLFDEIVVLDTGSKDRTIEIARSFGARVFDFVWVDDFGAARNAALARAKGDYAFWLDADDLIEPPERAKLEELFTRLGRGGKMPAFVVRCKCDPGPDGAGGDYFKRSLAASCRRIRSCASCMRTSRGVIRCCGIFRRRWLAARRGFRLTWKMLSCCFARRLCIEVSANRRRRSSAGGGS